MRSAGRFAGAQRPFRSTSVIIKRPWASPNAIRRQFCKIPPIANCAQNLNLIPTPKTKGLAVTLVAIKSTKGLPVITFVGKRQFSQMNFAIAI